MINVTNLTKKFDDKTLFKNVNFSISNNKKIALVGKNGCGKTTLFKMINGLVEPTRGNITITNENIKYIPQQFSFPDELVGIYLEEFLEYPSEHYKIDKLISKLDFKNYDPYQEIKTLSEGQKMKIKIIEMMLSDPTVLFIDEPTNHLDIEGIEWFEDYINSLDLSVIMISHDRTFLNNVVDEIWEIERKGIIKYSGNYDYYQEEKSRLIEKWNKEYKAQEKKRKQIEKLIENVRKIGGGKKRGKAVRAAKTRLRRIDENKKESFSLETMDNINIESEVHRSKLMLRLETVSKSYDSNKVFENLNLEVRGGEKIWLFGPNGGGKSTLVKIIYGIEDADNGEVTLGENIDIGYFSQVQPNTKNSNNILDEFTSRTGCFFAHAYGYLNKFLFKKEELNKLISQLSPGERARFELAVFSYYDYDMLILDEPDNHLDIETKEVLEDSLNQYEGTLLLVSHDRYFVGNSGITKVLNLKEGKLKGMLNI